MASGSYHWWRMAKQLGKISAEKPPLPELEMNGMVASTDKDKANLLPNFFSSQCTVPTQIGTADDAPGAPYPLPATSSEFHIWPVTEDVVLRHLRKLPACKSTADPILTDRMLRECAPFIHTSLAYFLTYRSRQTYSLKRGSKLLLSPYLRTGGTRRTHLTTDRYLFCLRWRKCWMLF